jgi:hypothetical protein
VIGPLVSALERSTLERAELAPAISQAVMLSENERLLAVAEKEKAEKKKEKAEKEKEKEKARAEKARAEKAEVLAEKTELVAGLRGELKKMETEVLRMHGKLSVRGAIGESRR